MLRELHIRNLAIVEDVRVELRQGLNVITGETGAGKSIIVGALGLILGERADRTVVRTGEQECTVEACFTLTDPSAADAVLTGLGMPACEENTLIIRRIISASGGGKNFVNDRPATLQALRQLGTLLVDMHGPHDHQSLLSRETQMDILDSFGHLHGARADYGKAYAALRDLERELGALDGDERTVAQEIDMLSYQVKEIEGAGLADDDEEKLVAEHTRAANAQQILQLAQTAAEGLTDSESSAFSTLVRVRAALDELSRVVPEGTTLRDEVEAAIRQVQEISRSVTGLAESVDADPARLQQLEERVALVHRLKRKYGQSIAAVLEFLGAARERLRGLETRGERVAELSKQIAAATADVGKAGAALRVQRETAAKKLAAAVTRELKALGFEHGVFSVGLTPCPPCPSGCDAIDFGFAPNPGEAMRSLKAIASSGEISRVMLATKAVLAAHDRIPVLVFDEVDANVGGEMGTNIGTKLSAIAKNHQVICITHLPQVAIHGTTHFVVAKRVAAGRTRTTIGEVAGDERTDEVARMLGGKTMTSVTLAHAAEMLRKKRA